MIQATIFAIILYSLCVFSPSTFAADNMKEAPQEVEAALRSALDYIATFQTNGGWAMAWTEDLNHYYGEHTLKDKNIITVQPPATPGIGTIFLKAGHALQDKRYHDIALEAAQALINGQLNNGGWRHEFYPEDSKDGTGTFDDKVTQGAITFLIDVHQITNDPKVKHSIKRGYDFILNSQYDNGGWPQRYPGGNGYGKNITLNDRAMMDVMRTLVMGYHEFGDQQYLDAALRGADCLIALRGDPPQAGWAQQFTPEGKPDSARTFEPVGLSSSESMDAVRVLKEIYLETGDKKYIEACIPVLDWLRNSKLENGKWSRLYEYGSNRPIYSTADGKLIYDIQQARLGYGWQGSYFDEKLEAEVLRLYKEPASKRHDVKDRIKPRSLSSLEKRALEAVSALDPKGRWVDGLSGSRRRIYLDKIDNADETMRCISSGTFVENAGKMIEFLEAVKPRMTYTEK